MENIYSLATNYLKSSGWINGTSNMEFSDWVLYTYFHIENGQPVAHFKVLDSNFSKNPPLFETNSYQELEKWVEEHDEELQRQIQDKLNKKS
jgi:hypothetical protein